MIIFSYVMAFLLIICIVLASLVLILSFFTLEDYNTKSSAFECGFQPFSSSGATFSMPFFVISLMFLLFDVEIIMMSFPSLTPNIFSFFMWMTIFLIFWATCYEWFSGIFSWISSNQH